ncbi:MAG: exo-alpha-sialidase [Chitinophagaceae bacterium]|nr:exo-alpha-sialidase [Chitinophagaceae bacterium]
MLSLSISLLIVNNNLPAQVNAKDVQHVKVYYEPGMYGGWPANNGIWIWGNEILVGFSKGFYKDLGSKHNIDRDKPQLHLLARSMDGGSTWVIEDPATKGLVPHGHFVAKPRTDVPQQKVIQLTEPINFQHAGFALTAYSNGDAGESRYWYSYDKGHNWNGPFALPNFGTPGTAARTDYIIDGKNECTLFITAAKSNGKEGRVICVRTTDGGKNWSLLSRIGEEPKDYDIMPASVRISNNEILVTTRKKEGGISLIPAWLSSDNGKSWTPLQNASDDTGIGNPPAMIKLKDGRICLVYGYRSNAESIAAKIKTSDIRARLSNDNGRSWSKEYILRNDGSGQDIGYPRIVQRPDGKVVVIYYFMDNITGRERYIGASIWEPPVAGKD